MSCKIHIAAGITNSGELKLGYCGLDADLADKEFTKLVSGSVPGIAKAFLWKKPNPDKVKKPNQSPSAESANATQIKKAKVKNEPSI